MDITTVSPTESHPVSLMRPALIATLLMLVPATTQAQSVKLHAAGSLKVAMTQIAKAFEASGGGAVEATYGPSGVLREKIEAGDTSGVFASADIGHPQKLVAAGRTASPVQIFARNKLCGLAQPGLDVTTQPLLQTLLDPKIRLGISTPKADPSGDYAFALFAKAEGLSPGAKSALEAKALQLTGGPNSAKPPAGQSAYAWVMSERQADVFLTYCTNAVVAQAEVPSLVIVQIPADLNVSADYGLVVMKDAPASASAFAAYIKSKDGQAILAQNGFGPGD